VDLPLGARLLFGREVFFDAAAESTAGMATVWAATKLGKCAFYLQEQPQKRHNVECNDDTISIRCQYHVYIVSMSCLYDVIDMSRMTCSRAG